MPLSGSHTWRASKAVRVGSAKGAERPRLGRAHGLLQTREKRSALLMLGVAMARGRMGEGLRLVDCIAAQTLPCPVPAGEEG
jgi:hypothetical protein